MEVRLRAEERVGFLQAKPGTVVRIPDSDGYQKVVQIVVTPGGRWGVELATGVGRAYEHNPTCTIIRGYFQEEG